MQCILHVLLKIQIHTDMQSTWTLTLLLLSTTCPVLANSVDPDQFASEGAKWSGSALFVIKNEISIKNLYQVIWLAGN